MSKEQILALIAELKGYVEMHRQTFVADGTTEIALCDVIAWICVLERKIQQEWH